MPAGKGLKAAYIQSACEASLKRLKTDRIDLYFSHFPDKDTPIEETLEAHQKLVDAGKVRAVGGSNYDAAGLTEALDKSGGKRARYTVLQPHYNLLVRDQYEGALEDLCAKEGLGVIPYFALASGFLTGKYRSEADLKKSPRGGRMKANFSERGLAILAALDKVAAAHSATPAQVALAWLMARPLDHRADRVGHQRRADQGTGACRRAEADGRRHEGARPLIRRRSCRTYW